MEEGSLLQKALSASRTTDADGENALENALMVDVYLLPLLASSSFHYYDDGDSNSTSDGSRIRYWQTLAAVCVELNEFIQQQQHDGGGYPWLYGGDGPVFGVHITQDDEQEQGQGKQLPIPHLRCTCRYGVSVADEWKLVGIMLDFTARSTTCSSSNRLAVECWDLDDGQVLLIQSAHELPSWVEDDHHPSEDEEQYCRHRCWIKEGKVHLIQPETTKQHDNDGNTYSNQDKKNGLSLKRALTLLETRSPLVSAPLNVNAVIQETVRRVKHPQHLYHRAALAVPRSVARLLQCRPNVAAAACCAFVEHAGQHEQLWRCSRAAASTSSTKARSTTGSSTKMRKEEEAPSLSPSPLAGTCQDWVWTTLNFGRTHYAMLRTFLAAPVWKTQDAIPSEYYTSSSSSNMVELKRLQRQSADAQATPQLCHGVQLGVRLVAGLDYILLLEQQKQQQQQQQDPVATTTHLERRVLQHWARLDRQLLCHNHHDGITTSDGCSLNDSWLYQAWEAGPNHHAQECSLESILKCPVYDPEVVSCETPLSHPDETLAAQVRKELLLQFRKQQQQSDNNCSNAFSFDRIPTLADVDLDDGWMTMPDEDMLREATAPIQVTTAAQQEEEPGVNNSNNNNNNVLGKMLGGVHSFLQGKSDVQGVVSNNNNSEPKNKKSPQQRGVQINPTVFSLKAKSADELVFIDTNTSTKESSSDPFFSQQDYEMEDSDGDDDSEEENDVQINPTVFLNILHATLKAKSADELVFIDTNTSPKESSSDPFFSQQDYEMEDSDGDDDSEEENDNNEPDEINDMTVLMEAMDQELLGSDRSAPTMSRSLDREGVMSSSDDNDDVAESTHVLSNLLKSLDAGGGAAGPVRNMLQEMGIKPPDLPPSSTIDDQT